MDLKDLILESAPLTVTYMGETLKLSYRPALLTTEYVAQAENSNTIEALTEMFAELIVSWDLTSGGVPVPIEAASMNSLPIHLLRQIFSDIQEDNPKGEAGRRSSDG